MANCFKKLLILILLCSPALLSAKGRKEKSISEPPAETPQERAERILAENEGAAYAREPIDGTHSSFDEVWGFALQERSEEIDLDTPLTDIALFTATLNNYAELDAVPRRAVLSSFAGRVHLTFACDSRALVHFVLDEKFGLRKQFEKSLADAASDFDGLCIDMEYIPARDRKNFLIFLRDMKKAIGKDKVFSVCVPARTRTIADDIFPYKTIGEIADRVIIMAYDEHWSTSSPGPVASYAWCGNVADYALTVIPKEKIVMGLPFYGRTWMEERHAGAWYFSGINRKMLENGVPSVERDEGGVANISYTATVNITGYFDDTYSLVKKCRLYEEKQIANISFWRLGQEDKTFWRWIKIGDGS